MWGWLLKGLAATGILGLFGITLDSTTKAAVKAVVVFAGAYVLLKHTGILK